jgi:hypothetical protein
VRTLLSASTGQKLIEAEVRTQADRRHRAGFRCTDRPDSVRSGDLGRGRSGGAGHFPVRSLKVARSSVGRTGAGPAGTLRAEFLAHVQVAAQPYAGLAGHLGRTVGRRGSPAPGEQLLDGERGLVVTCGTSTTVRPDSDRCASLIGFMPGITRRWSRRVPPLRCVHPTES